MVQYILQVLYCTAMYLPALRTLCIVGLFIGCIMKLHVLYSTVLYCTVLYRYYCTVLRTITSYRPCAPCALLALKCDIFVGGPTVVRLPSTVWRSFPFSSISGDRAEIHPKPWLLWSNCRRARVNIVLYTEELVLLCYLLLLHRCLMVVAVSTVQEEHKPQFPCTSSNGSGQEDDPHMCRHTLIVL